MGLSCCYHYDARAWPIGCVGANEFLVPRLRSPRTTLVGVVNLTNRAQRAAFNDDDVERVRLLALVISLIATQARLPERLMSTLAAVP